MSMNGQYLVYTTLGWCTTTDTFAPGSTIPTISAAYENEVHSDT